MVHNTFTWEVEGKSNLHLVDIPGHERIRGSIVDQFSGSARGIVYMVDSNTVSKQIRDVAEFLHTILSNKAVNKNR
jgi:signal recognition particle receptor subunit beta